MLRAGKFGLQEEWGLSSQTAQTQPWRPFVAWDPAVLIAVQTEQLPWPPRGLICKSSLLELKRDDLTIRNKESTLLIPSGSQQEVLCSQAPNPDESEAAGSARSQQLCLCAGRALGSSETTLPSSLPHYWPKENFLWELRWSGVDKWEQIQPQPLLASPTWCNVCRGQFSSVCLGNSPWRWRELLSESLAVQAILLSFWVWMWNILIWKGKMKRMLTGCSVCSNAQA